LNRIDKNFERFSQGFDDIKEAKLTWLIYRIMAEDSCNQLQKYLIVKERKKKEEIEKRKHNQKEQKS